MINRTRPMLDKILDRALQTAVLLVAAAVLFAACDIQPAQLIGDRAPAVVKGE